MRAAPRVVSAGDTSDILLPARMAPTPQPRVLSFAEEEGLPDSRGPSRPTSSGMPAARPMSAPRAASDAKYRPA